MELNDYGPISQAHTQYQRESASGTLVISIILAFVAGAATTYLYMKSMQQMKLNKDPLID